MSDPNAPERQAHTLEHEHAHAGTDNLNVRREYSDVNARGIVSIGVGMIAAAIVIHVGVYFLFRALEETNARSPDKRTETVAGEQHPPSNALERTRQPPLEGLERLGTPETTIRPEDVAASDAVLLSRTGPLDPPQAGFVHIPIDQAMKLVAENKDLQKQVLPAPASPATEPGSSPLDQPTQSNAGRGPRPGGRK